MAMAEPDQAVAELKGDSRKPERASAVRRSASARRDPEAARAAADPALSLGRER